MRTKAQEKINNAGSYKKKKSSHTCKNDCSKTGHPYKQITLGNKMMTNTNHWIIK